MPLETKKVFRIGSEKWEVVHFLSCVKCDHTIRVSDEQVERYDDYVEAAESWLCQECDPDETD